MREKLIELLRSNPTVLETAGKSATSLLRLADFLIASGVTIPVRCKDCKHAIKNDMYGDNWCNGLRVPDNWYCADGERKDNG